MQTSERTAEQLHQQASASYLQGKFAEALVAWRQILQANPDDERAKEGLRLCELLTEDGAIAPEAAAVADPAPPTETPAQLATEDPVEFDVPELELDLPSLDFVGPDETVSPAEARETPDPDRQTAGIELGDTPETLELAGQVPSPAPAAEIVDGIVEQKPDGVEREIPDSDVEFDAHEAGASDAAGTELQRRAQDLMSEAVAAYVAGDNDTARSVLARVFILDETHADALQLQEAIENGVPPVTDFVDVADLDAPEHIAPPGEFDLLSEDPDAETIEPAEQPIAEDVLQLSSIETDPVSSTASGTPDDLPEFPEFDEDELLAEGDAETAAAPAPAEQKRIRLPQPALAGSKTKLIGIVVVVAIVAAVGGVFWMRLQGTKIRDEPLPAIQAAAEAALAPGETAPVESAAETPAAAEGSAATSAAPVDVGALMAEGREAMQNGEYAAAIVAFHAVVEADPTQIDANERMQAATEAYKQQQEIEKQWLAAAGLFRDGEHRSALKMFYRLEPDNDEDSARLERYKRNGWYNMAVLALRAGHCDLAQSHLAEAAEIDAQDPDVATAQALADSCHSGSRRNGYQLAIQVLKLRGLDD